MFSAAFAPLAFAGVEPWAAALLEIVFFWTAASLLKSPRLCPESVCDRTLLPAALFMAALAALQCFSQRPADGPASLLPFTFWRVSTAKAALWWLALAALVWSVPRIITDWRQLKKISWTIFLTGMVISLIGMLQKSEVNGMIYGLRRVSGMPFGPFVNRDHAASYLAMAALAGLGILCSRLTQWPKIMGRSRRADFLATQFTTLVMVSVVVGGIIKTGSRGGLAAFALAAFAGGWVSSGLLRRRKKLAARTALLLAAGGYCFFLLTHPYFLGFSGAKLDHTLLTRLSLYRSSLAMFMDFPVFGAGLGAVSNGFQLYQESSVHGFVRHVHSDWLELLLQTGVVGTAVYLTGFLLLLKRGFSLWKNCPSREVRALCGGFLAAALAFSLHGFMDFSFQMPANAVTFFLLLSLVGTLPVKYGKSEPEPKICGPAGDALPAAAFGALLLLSLPQVIGWIYSRRAVLSPADGRPALYQKALACDPDPRLAFQTAAAYYNLALKNPARKKELFSSAYETAARYAALSPADRDLAALKAAALIQIENP